MKVFDYHSEAALWSTSGTGIARIGVISHETGNFFGLPDLYDTDNSSRGIASWCLMANSWGFDNSQRYPPHLSAWCKIQLGWVTPTEATAGVNTLPRVATSPTVKKISAGFPSGEYLLIENRQPYGMESIMPQGGLAIWHIDESKSGNTEEGHPQQSGWPANGRHYKVALLQADGLYDLERNRNRGDGGDVFHAGGASSLTSLTTPGTNSYKGGVVASSGNSITNISASGTNMNFTLNGAGGAPVITSAATASVAPGSTFSYQITATNSPTSFSASGLPAGISLNTSSGLISGTSSTPGSFPVSLGATNAAGTGSLTLTITVAQSISLASALDTSGMSWTTGGNAAWDGQDTINHDGTDAAASGKIGDQQQSWVETTITGSGTLNFWWKVSSESTYDFLRFTVNGTEQSAAPGISGESGWQQRSINLSAGTNILRWSFSKDQSVANGDDAAWLDQVVFVPNQQAPVITSVTTTTAAQGQPFGYQITAGNSPTGFAASGLPAGLSVSTSTGLISGTPVSSGVSSITLSATNQAGTGTATLTLTVNSTTLSLEQALDATSLAWTTAGDASWRPQTSTTHDGTDAGESGDISDNATSYVETTVTGPGTLGFWWRVSSEQNYDYLRFTVDGDEQATAPGISGESGWQQRTVNIGSGTHILRWTFRKDVSVSSASDAAWLDEVTFSAGQQAPAITSSPTATGVTGQAFSYQITASNSPASFQANGLPQGLVINPTSGLISGTPSTSGTFNITLSATNAAGTGAGNLSLTVSGTQLTLAQALDSPALPWRTGGTATWLPQTATSHDGLHAGESGTLTHNQESWVATDVIGPGTLTFWWQVSSETNYDFLSFTLDGNRVAGIGAISGTPGWQQQTVVIPAGTHEIRWSYTKDSSVDSNADRAWLDQISYAGNGGDTEFTNTEGISIPSSGDAGPYPSAIEVSGISGTVTSLRVELKSFSHSWPSDLQVFLMAPDGRLCSLMSDKGSLNTISAIDVAFSDDAASALPENSQITAGTYLPDFASIDAPLPPGGIATQLASLTSLASVQPNGTWKLFVRDTAAGDLGSIGSWSLTLDSSAAIDSLVLPAISEQENSLNTPIRDTERTLQYVFDSSLLGAIQPGSQISSIAFRLNDGSSTWPAATRTWSQFNLQIGKSANAPGSLSNTFSENLGTDTITARSGSLTVAAGSYSGGSSPNTFGSEIIFSTPYTYTGGDILITIRHTGNGSDTEFTDAKSAVPGMWQAIYSSAVGAFTASEASSEGSTPVTRFRIDSGSQPAIQNWRMTHFGAASNSGDAADSFDYDHDGIVNLLEFAFMMDPRSGNIPHAMTLEEFGMPLGEMADDNGTERFRLRFLRRKDQPGLTYRCHFGSDPGSMTLSTTPANIVESNSVAEIVEVWDTASGPGIPKRFGRVEVTNSSGD